MIAPTVRVLNRGIPALGDEETAFWEADAAEWLHGQRCASADCAKCIFLMTATDAARRAWDAARRSGA